MDEEPAVIGRGPHVPPMSGTSQIAFVATSYRTRHLPADHRDLPPGKTLLDMIDKVTSAICDPPSGSLNVAVNFCGEPASTDNIAETGDAMTGADLRVVEQPQRIRLKQRLRPRRTFELSHQYGCSRAHRSINNWKTSRMGIALHNSDPRVASKYLSNPDSEFTHF